METIPFTPESTIVNHTYTILNDDKSGEIDPRRTKVKHLDVAIYLAIGKE